MLIVITVMEAKLVMINAYLIISLALLLKPQQSNKLRRRRAGEYDVPCEAHPPKGWARQLETSSG